MVAHSTYNLGYLVRYTASLIISSLTNFDTEEVIYLIRVRTRSDKSIIYAGVYKINGGKKHAAILVRNRRGAISDKPTREVLRKEFEILSEQILLEGGPLWGRRKRSIPSDNNDIVPSPLARKIKPDTPPTTLWENKRTTSQEYIPNIEQTFIYSDYNGVKRHFRTSYLTDRIYNFCDLSVLHEMHL
ncbi:zinc finger protein [Penicillium samsonianum]|uniref:zinc finger protein n=1 Tax=Penicillium samsonianum TaxID=1882272 RepID=UPI00254760C2|nr:zinc finger protein [Penicillium samsonianum]KAJ6138765.1 zinc finger protein [Penicillium samsonianum]